MQDIQNCIGEVHGSKLAHFKVDKPLT